MTDARPRRPRPRWLLPVLILFTIVCVLLLVPTVLMAVTAPMLSDSGVNLGVWVLMLGGLLGPFFFLLSPIVAWVGFGTARYRLAIWAMAAPLAWFAYMAGAFGLVNLSPPHN